MKKRRASDFLLSVSLRTDGRETGMVHPKVLSYFMCFGRISSCARAHTCQAKLISFHVRPLTSVLHCSCSTTRDVRPLYFRLRHPALHPQPLIERNVFAWKQRSGDAERDTAEISRARLRPFFKARALPLLRIRRKALRSAEAMISRKAALSIR